MLLFHLVLSLLHSHTCMSMKPARQVMIISRLQLRDKNPRKDTKGVPAGGSWVWIQPRAFLWECGCSPASSHSQTHAVTVNVASVCPVFLPAQPRVTLNWNNVRNWMFVVFLHSLNFIYRGSYYSCKLHYIQLVNVHFTYFNPLPHKIVLMYVNDSGNC